MFQLVTGDGGRLRHKLAIRTIYLIHSNRFRSKGELGHRPVVEQWTGELKADFGIQSVSKFNDLHRNSLLDGTGNLLERQGISAQEQGI